MTCGLPLMKSVRTPLAISVSITWGLAEGMSAAVATIQKKLYGSRTTIVII